MQEVADQDGFEDVELLLVHCHRKNGSGGSRGGGQWEQIEVWEGERRTSF